MADVDSIKAIEAHVGPQRQCWGDSVGKIGSRSENSELG